MASPVNLDPDPSTVIPIAVRGTLNILKSAAKEKTVKRFVLTSSSSAVAVAKPNERLAITTDTWNEEAVQMASSLPDDLSVLQKGFVVYAASKVKAEQAMWDWVKANKPDLVVNSGNPLAQPGKPNAYSLHSNSWRQLWQDPQHGEPGLPIDDDAGGSPVQ